MPCLPGQIAGLENATGNGEIHCYRLFDGVTLMLLRLEMESYTEVRTEEGLLEINFCVNGRFESRFSLRDQVLLKPGDMAVSSYDGRHGSRSESWFPLGYYEGICLEIEQESAKRWILQNAAIFSIDFAALKQNLLSSSWYMTGSVLLIKGSIDVLTFFLFLLLASRLYDPMQGALQNLAAIIAMRTNVARMNEIFDYPVQNGRESRSPGLS